MKFSHCTGSRFGPHNIGAKKPCKQTEPNSILKSVRLPPGTKPIHAGKKSWGINFCANTCGACIRTRANTGKCFRRGISRVFCQNLRGIHSVRIHAAPVFALREYRKIFLANYLCIGFVPGGNRCKNPSEKSVQNPCLPPPSKKLLTQKNSRGIIFGVIAMVSRNQLRKKIL